MMEGLGDFIMGTTLLIFVLISINEPVDHQEICLHSTVERVTIYACRMNIYVIHTEITGMTHLDREYLDGLQVGNQPILVILTPVSMTFDDSYSQVIFAGHALQQYFPHLADYQYVALDKPTKITNNIREYPSIRCMNANFCSLTIGFGFECRPKIKADFGGDQYYLGNTCHI